MKYNIPARTLRDWMKRLNIKSVFTHHSQKDGRSLSADSSEYSLISGESNPGNPNEEEETNEEIVPEEEDVEKSPDSESKECTQGGKGEVVGQLSCIYETITTKILKKLKTFLFDFLNFQTKINLEKKISK